MIWAIENLIWIWDGAIEVVLFRGIFGFTLGYGPSPNLNSTPFIDGKDFLAVLIWVKEI